MRGETISRAYILGVPIRPDGHSCEGLRSRKPAGPAAVLPFLTERITYVIPMALRTVRLDPESKRLLKNICSATGLSVSAALKRGLASVEREIAKSARSPFSVYSTLDLGPGGYVLVPEQRAKEDVRADVR